MKIRSATTADLDAIVALERSIENAPHWSRSSYAEALAPAASVAVVRKIFLAADRSAGTPAVIGLAVVALAKQDPQAAGELESIAVAPAARRSGAGRALLQAAADWLRSENAAEIDLEVRAGSAAAIALYASLGFMQAGRRRSYYRDPREDALLMRLPLSSAE